MVESTIPCFELKDLSVIPETQVPFLCEIWNWQGDTSVLPYKVTHLSLYEFEYLVG